MLQPSLPRLAAALLLLLSTSLAHAQYVWVDAKGTRQYSDRPPPPGTPPHKILKAPGRLAPAPAPEASSDNAAPDAPVAKPKDPTQPPTLAERDKAFRERQKQAAEQERKDADERDRKADAAARCEAARDAHAQLVSGIRISRIEKNGERSYMSDEERAARAAQMEKILRECR